jgi:hypothetical protein
MSRVNAAIQGTDVSPTFWGPLYEAVGQALRTAATVPASAPTDALRPWLLGAAELEEKLDLNVARLTGDALKADEHVAPTDRAALRDRIRRALCEAEGFGWDTDMLEHDEYGEVADAVLAVLPAPADRAAILREAADALPEADLRLVPPMDRKRVANWLRRLADAASGPGRADGETQQDEAQKPCVCSHPADEHSVYGCSEGCGCEWMPKRRPAMDPVHILGVGSDEDCSALRAALLGRQQPVAVSQPDGEA